MNIRSIRVRLLGMMTLLTIGFAAYLFDYDLITLFQSTLNQLDGTIV